MGADAARRPMGIRDRHIYVKGFRTATPVGS